MLEVGAGQGEDVAAQMAVAAGLAAAGGGRDLGGIERVSAAACGTAGERAGPCTLRAHPEDRPPCPNVSPEQPHGELAVRLIAMPADTNANGDIFGGWVLSQMDRRAASPRSSARKDGW